MRWLVTGGCGFIGTNLIARLRESGDHSVRVLDNLTVGEPADLERVAPYERLERPDAFGAADGPVQLVKGDIRAPDDVARAMKNVDVIVHLAACTGVIPSVENPRFDAETNVLGTLNVLEAARHAGAKRFVFASSGAPLGEQEPPIHEQKVPKPVSPYGASKLAGEAYCSAYFQTFGIQTVALRFGNVYGPRSFKKGSVVALWIRQALAGETLTIYGDGSQTRDFIYIDDLVRAIELGAAYKSGGEAFQIATNRETTVNEVAEAIQAELEGRGVEVKTKYEDARAGEVLRNYSDITKARTELGWEPEFDLAAGLKETVDWFFRERDAAR